MTEYLYPQLEDHLDTIFTSPPERLFEYPPRRRPRRLCGPEGCPLEISAPGTIAVEVYIDRHLCCDYRICIDMCSMGVFGVVDGVVYPVRMHLCITCLQCTEFCPTRAISTRWTVRA